MAVSPVTLWACFPKEKFPAFQNDGLFSSDSDDDDFIEVEDKPGFEDTVPAEDHVLGIPFFYDGPSTSKGKKKIRSVWKQLRSEWDKLVRC